MNSIKINIETVKKSIGNDINLIAVSKTRTIEEIQFAYDAGILDFGENKVKDLLAKYDNFPKDVRWHFIGNLQKNKVKHIVGKVFLIQSLNSVELLKEIEKRFGSLNLSANVLVEVNIGEEKSKSGIHLSQIEDLILECENCSHVKIKGLMAVIPKGDEYSCREYFKKMKELFESLKSKSYNNTTMEYLSMGMTGDYKFALMEGSNMIRIGEGIFGKRI